MATIVVDGVEFEVDEGQNLLHACLSQGLELPYFCWHPSLGSVGACRQCAVIQYADADDTRGRLTMACMTPAKDGTRISIQTETAKQFRASVIEWLMENHPHDCPVCEEGGECHLQDMTVMTGHTQRRYRGRKRTFENQYLGPFLNHEMNRCITCYRCVRFYNDYAGGTDLQVFGSRDRMYFGRTTDGVLENEFSGNLIEVCPTGVFTDKPFSESYTRKWDLSSAPSICAGCAVGCNTFVSERYGRLKRVHNRYHGELNGYFLCDRGRFGAGFVNSTDRIEHVGERVEDDFFDVLDVEVGIAKLAEMIRQGDVVGIGSPRASLETNVALKTLVGEAQFCTGMSSAEESLVDLIIQTQRATSADIPSLSDVESADAVLILGEDVLNTAPRVALALRQTVRNRALNLAGEAGIPQWQDAGVSSHAQGRLNPLFIAGVLPSGIDDIAADLLHDVPLNLADCGFAIAACIGEATGSEPGFVRKAAAALRSAQNPLIVSGTSTRTRAIVEAAGAVVAALESAGKAPRLLLVAPEANSFGSGLIGGGLDMNTALQRVASGSTKTLIVAENDIFRRAERERVEQALCTVENLVVLDSLDTPTASLAGLVFPAATFAESTGTFVNYETRAQRFYCVFEPRHEIAPSWRWLAQAATDAGRDDLGWTHVDDVLEAVAASPNMAGVRAVAPDAGYLGSSLCKTPRETPRFSGRTAMNANVNIHEPKTSVDEETPLSFSMEGLNRDQPSALLPFVWAPGWNSNQSVFKFQQEVGGAAAGGDPGVRLLASGSIGTMPARSASVRSDRGGVDTGFRLIPVQAIFGSDELSSRSPPVVERSSAAFMIFSPMDAERLGATQGMGVSCSVLGATFAVTVDAAMKSGYVGVSVGFTGAEGELPDGLIGLAVDPNYRPTPNPHDRVIARG